MRNSLAVKISLKNCFWSSFENPCHVLIVLRLAGLSNDGLTEDILTLPSQNLLQNRLNQITNRRDCLIANQDVIEPPTFAP